MRQTILSMLVVTLFGLSAPPVSVGAAGDEEQKAVLSNEQIQQALQPPVTRSFAPRGLARRQADGSGQSVNLNIPFEHNSSALMPQAAAQLKELELALNSASLGKDKFLVAGHTDAKGMDAGRLTTVGFGSEKLLAPDRPEDPSNRRVEIRDLGSGN